VSVADVSSNLDDTDFAIHLRMFDRNYVPLFDSQALQGKFQTPRRHYAKQAWSDERVQGLLRAVKMLCREPQSVYVFTDRYEHPIVERIRSELSKDGYDLKEFRSQKPHGLEALEELVALSMFRRMILTSFSSFGHLAALIGENVETVVSV